MLRRILIMIKMVNKKLPVLTNRIKELRNNINMSQEELADKVGVRRETIGHLENNKYNPSLKLAFDIATVFNLPIESVLWYE